MSIIMASAVTTYPAFKVYREDKDEPIAIVWWDGTTLRSSSEKILKSIKDKAIDGMSYSAGKEFFDKLPRAFKSGYVYLKKAEVSKDGKLI